MVSTSFSPSTSRDNNHVAQNLFMRVVSETLDKEATPQLNLDKRATRVTPFSAGQGATKNRQDLGDLHFTLFSFTPPKAYIGAAMLKVFTESSFEMTNTLLGNWDTLHELNFFQAQDLSQTSQTFFNGFLAHLTSCTNHYNLFSSLTIMGGNVVYGDIEPSSPNSSVLTAIIPYTLPSVGRGNFLLTIQIEPRFSHKHNL